jgi:hypothetical protein
MAETPESRSELSDIELLLDRQQYEEALDTLAHLIDENPSNKQIRIYRLLAVRILLLQQSLAHRTAQNIKPVPPSAEGQFVASAKAFSNFVTTALNRAFDVVAESARASMFGRLVRRPALAIGAVALLVTPITCYVSRSLGVVEPGFHTAGALPTHLAVINATPMRMDEQSLHALLANQLSPLQRLYGHWIQEHGNVTGSLVLKLTVDDLGHVSRVDNVGSCLSDSALAKAVMEVAHKWVFPETHGTAGEVIVPLILVPKGVDPTTVQGCDTISGAARQAKTSAALHVAATPPDSLRSRVRKSQLDNEIAPRPRNPQTTLALAYKTRNSLPLRQHPRFASVTLQQIAPGTHIDVIGANGDWLKVKTPNSSAVGYLRKEFVIAANTTP